MDDLNNLEIQILKVLEGHQGKENFIRRFDLVDQINAEMPLFPVSERRIRMVKQHLITQHGFAIGSKGGKRGGYYMCETPDEIDRVAKYFDGIGLCSLFTASKLKKIEMKDYLGQLSLRFGG
jgi:hypothetical protein